MGEAVAIMLQTPMARTARKASLESMVAIAVVSETSKRYSCAGPKILENEMYAMM